MGQPPSSVSCAATLAWGENGVEQLGSFYDDGQARTPVFE